ncbi:MAG TPA: S8 family peptidase [Terriglobales bacterium]|nr:S8 family peptidase [Terriglobales bacterium]
MNRVFRIAVLCLAASTIAAQRSPEGNVKLTFRNDTVLVGFNSGVGRQEQDRILTIAGAREQRVIGQGVHVLSVPAGRLQQTIDVLRKIPAVRYAELDFRHSLNATPGDPFFPEQWPLLNTGQQVNGSAGTAGADESATKAWNITTGTRSIVVGIADTGIDYNHPDLAANIWSNPGGINGCAAGTHGYNVLTGACDPMDDDTAYNGHGTHVAGIIGAAGNNSIGVTGVNWQTTLLGVKWVDANGYGYTSDLISALDWLIRAKQAGVNLRIVNDSQTWVGTASSQALSDEIDALGTNDILFVTAAGNTAQDNDTTPRYPCVYDRPNQICAAASDQNDGLWSSSNYGRQTVQLAAPGVNIYSTLRNGTYGFISGCSMSAAEVSGAAALVLSTGYQSASALRSTLLGSVDVLPAFTSVTQTGGRLDICKAISGCANASPVNTGMPSISGTTVVGQQLTSSNGTWSGNPTSFGYQWERCDANGANCSGIAGATSSTYLLSNGDVSSTLRSIVTASNSSGSTAATSQQSAVVQGSGTSLSLVQKASAQASGVPSLSVSFPNANTGGNAIIAFVRASTTWQSVSVTDSRGNNYVDAGQQTQSSDGHQIHIFYAANILAGPNSVTASFSGTNNHPWLAICEYSGLSSMNALDVSASAEGSNASPFTGNTAQTHAAHELVFTGLGLPSSSSVSVTAGGSAVMELQQPNAVGSRAATEDAIVTGIGTYSGSFSLSSATNWSAVVATFMAAGSGSPPLTVATTSLPQATQGSSYSAVVSASGGATPYSWTESGNFPPGLSLSSSGSIAGIPSNAGSYSFTIQVKDANGSTATQALTLQVVQSSTPPISLVQSAAIDGSSVSSVSQAFPNQNSAGNLIVAFVRMSTTSQTVQVTDSLGNTYIDAVSQAQSADGHQTHIFYAKNIAGGANTVTASFSSLNGHPWLAIYEYSGLNPSSPLDATAHAQGSSSTASSGPTATTASAQELVFAGLGLPASSTQTVAATSGYALLQQDAPPNHSRGANEHAIVTTTGQYAGSFTLNGAANWTAVVATFRQ